MKSNGENYKEYHKNPRKISEYELNRLRQNIDELGDLSGITIDVTTNEIITGNQRCKAVDILNCEKKITQQLENPDKQGTVEVGYFVVDGGYVNYRKVQWNDQQREKANITANKLGGEWDWDVLNSEEWDKNILIDSGFESLDFKAKDNFKPKLDPKSDTKKVTQGDIDKAESNLSSQVKTQAHRTILCPHCMKEFEIENK